MSLREPEHSTESDEADWLYEHRHLLSAESVIDGAAGRLVRGDLETGTYISVPPWQVPASELEQARQLLVDSGMWIENQGPIIAPGTKISPGRHMLMQQSHAKADSRSRLAPVSEQELQKAS